MQPVPIQTPVIQLIKGLAMITRPWALFLQALRSARGMVEGNLADIPTGLGPGDKGLLFHASDFNHVYQWNGTAWKWGPGEIGSGYIAGHAIAPTGVGWQICDGSVVSYAKEDGTTANFVTPDLVSTPDSAAYMRLGDGYAGTNLAIPPTVIFPVTTGAPSGAGTEVQSGTGETVASAGHTHDITAMLIDNDGEPQRIQLIPYFRR